MFDHFTFGIQPQARYLQDEVSASPTDISFNLKQAQDVPAPPTEYPFPRSEVIDEIVDKFTDYTLRHEHTHLATQPTRHTTTESSATFNDMPMSFVSTRRGLIHIVRSSSASVQNSESQSVSSSSSSSKGTDVGCKRLQRQLNTQLQTCTNHVRDITSLVENMISSGSQCRLHAPASTQSNVSPPLTSPHLIGSSLDDLEVDEEMSEDDDFTLHVAAVVDPNEDEGFAEMDDDDEDMAVTLRRASAPSGIRKHGAPHPSNFSKYNRMGKGLNTYMPREKHKIRSVPRVRRRNHLNNTTLE